MPAPLGNQNAAKGARWRRALERALRKRGGESAPYDGIESSPEMKALEEIAEQVVNTAADGPKYVKGDPWLGVVSLLSDRIDGKAPQQLIHSGDADSDPIAHRIEQVIVDSNDTPR